MSAKLAAFLQSAPKRTLSDLLGQLPAYGVGTCVARDTWHPESGKFWEVTRVQPKKVGLDLFCCFAPATTWVSVSVR